MSRLWDQMVMSHLSPSDTEADLKNLNVVAMLHHFWEQKQVRKADLVKGPTGQSGGAVQDTPRYPESLLLYESAPSPGAPYVYYVTLPGGSCFGSYQVCETQAEARRDAARVALMNSLVGELPSHRITPHFINQSLREAAATSAVCVGDSSDPSTSIGVYRLLLATHTGRTMLEFQETMTVFQLLHWNGSLKVLRERRCSRQNGIGYYSQRGLDASMRSSMALDWLAREQRSAGCLGEELRVAQRELGLARRRGVELRFYKEKTEILTLALSQASVDGPLDPPSPEPGQNQDQDQDQETLPLSRFYLRDTLRVESLAEPPYGRVPQTLRDQEPTLD